MYAISSFVNRLIQDDCIHTMQQMPSSSVDCILTDPPYLGNYRDRSGRSILNDRDGQFLLPVFAELHGVLKPNRYAISFYGWQQVDFFMRVWKDVGFRPVGHLIFTKSYASSHKFTAAHHEAAFLLAKGRPLRPETPLKDLIPFPYTGNKLHPTQKPVPALKSLLATYAPSGGIVLDPFSGSGSTAMAARALDLPFIGIEKDAQYHTIAAKRLGLG